MSWRTIDGTKITSIKDVAQPWSAEAMTVLPLNMLGKVLLEAVEKSENVKVQWRCKVRDVGTDEREGKAFATFEREGKEERIEGDYLVGCDGANSQVRKSLFGDEYPGKTWDAQIVATNVRLPLLARISHP